MEMMRLYEVVGQEVEQHWREVAWVENREFVEIVPPPLWVFSDLLRRHSDTCVLERHPLCHPRRHSLLLEMLHRNEALTSHISQAIGLISIWIHCKRPVEAMRRLRP